MFRGTLVAVVILASVVWVHGVTKEEFMKSCGKVLHSKCCKMDYSIHLPKPETIENIMKECSQLPHSPPSCEREICIANKRGFASADGKIDKTKVTEIIEQDFRDLPGNLVTSIKDNCINADITVHGPPDECEVMKFKKCLKLQMLATCPEWDDTDQCAGMKDAAAECTKLFS